MYSIDENQEYDRLQFNSLKAIRNLFIVVTAVDILRKRPRLFGVWLAASLTFIAFQIQAAPANLHVGGNVSWFVFSAFKIYSTGSRRFVFALPVGTIVYWCLRKRLLYQKLMMPKG